MPVQRESLAWCCRRKSLGTGRISCLFVVVTLLLTTTIGAQSRTRVGVAFAGGGAKGAAHVGVLRVMEELQIPIDYVAGTSMGSIIGGLYASGMSVDEIERLLLETDWNDVMQDAPARRTLSFRRKEDDQRYLASLEVGVGKKGLILPSGLRSGQKLYFLLQRLTLPVAGVDDFDRLPTPFRAVATDIGRGQMVVLDRGDLAGALRASMAIPSIFSPVERDGRVLVDGGLTNNVPVDVVREMGADVVIAIDLGAPLADRETVSLVQIYQQTMRMLTRLNMEPRLEQADLVIDPSVSQFGTLEFDQVPRIIELGEERARELAASLQRYAVSEEEFEEWRRTREPSERGPLAPVRSIAVGGNERVDERIIRERIRQQPGEPLDLERLEQDLLSIYGLGDFERVDFSWLHPDDEARDAGSDLSIVAREKPWGPNYLRFNVSLQTDLEGEGRLGLLSNLTLTRLNRLGAELRTDLFIGRERGLLSELYQPLDFGGRNFVATSLRVGRDRLSVFESGREAAELRLRGSDLRLDLGRQFGSYGELRLGLLYRDRRTRLQSGTLPVDFEAFEAGRFETGALSLRLAIDRLDSVRIPRRGGVLRLEALHADDSLGGDEDFTRLEMMGLAIATRGRNSVFGSLAGGFSGDEGLPLSDQFTLGGPWSFSGLESDELRGDEYAVGRLGYLFHLTRTLSVGSWFELGNTWFAAEDSFEDLLFGGTVFAGIDSKLGPVYFGYGRAEAGRDRFFLVLGRSFGSFD